MPSDCVELFNTVNPVIAVAVSVPLTCKLSDIVTALESVDDITFVSIVFALKVPETFNASLICTAVESLELIVFVSIVSTLKVPDIFKLSETVTALESSELIVFTCNVSLILIELESSALKVVPLILIAPIIMFPVPDADTIKSSFDLVPSIWLSLI